jgi:hypothetical protein
LARPLGDKVHYKANHEKIAIDLMAAAKEITGASNVSVVPPNKKKYEGTPIRHPLTFLIHDLTANEMQHLLSRNVWASNELAFQTSIIPPERPDFIFTMKGLHMESTTHVREVILQTWKSHACSAFLRGIIDQLPDKKRFKVELEIRTFLDSVYVKRLDYKVEGGRINPLFNIYAGGSIIESADIWIDIRSFLYGRTYKSNILGKGSAIDSRFYCAMCHGRDHPTGMCAFPKIPGWKIALTQKDRENARTQLERRYPRENGYNRDRR